MLQGLLLATVLNDGQEVLFPWEGTSGWTGSMDRYPKWPTYRQEHAMTGELFYAKRSAALRPGEATAELANDGAAFVRKRVFLDSSDSGLAAT